MKHEEVCRERRPSNERLPTPGCPSQVTPKTVPVARAMRQENGDRTAQPTVIVYGRTDGKSWVRFRRALFNVVGRSARTITIDGDTDTVRHSPRNPEIRLPSSPAGNIVSIINGGGSETKCKVPYTHAYVYLSFRKK